MTVAESRQGAVIGAVACLPKFRNKGYGTYIVNHLTNILVKEGRSVFVHRAENANKAFYDNSTALTAGVNTILKDDKF